MAGVLAFTLGLENAEFIEKLGISERVMVSLEVGVESLKTVFEKCWQAIEKGAALQALHARTGESVGSLYQLQEAFKAVEIDAGAVGGMLFKTEKFLGGITEEGEKTDEILARLGLTLDGLRKLEPGKTFAVVAEQLHKLDAATAANIAGKLYGREGAGNMIQIANSAREFHEAMELSAKDAKIWQEAAHAFHEIAMYAGIISGHLSTFWAGLASGAAPAILKVEKALEKIDFGAIGVQFGKAIDHFANIIRDGKLGEFLKLSFAAAIEEINNVFLATIVGISAALDTMATNFGETFAGALRKAFKDGFTPDPQTIAQAKQIAKGIGFGGFGMAGSALGTVANLIPGGAGIGLISSVAGALSQAEKIAVMKQNSGVAFGQQPNVKPDILSQFNAGFSQVMANVSHGNAAALAAFWKSFGTLPTVHGGPQQPPGPGDSTNTEHDKPKFTDLERIGFVINAGGSRNDAQTSIANNTEKQLQEQREMNRQLKLVIEQQAKMIRELSGHHANVE